MLNRIHRFLPALILLCGILAYVSSFGGAFIFDDMSHIARSRKIANLSAYVMGSSRPLTALTFHLNYLVSGREPVDYHAVNILIHLGAALLLYGIVWRTLLAGGIAERWGDGRRCAVAFLSALLWVVHPLQTGGVTYIVQRAESLMGFLYLLTLYAVVRSAAPGRRGAWVFTAVAACSLGMAAKPIMVTCPLMVLLYDRTFLTSSFREAIRSRKVLYSGLAASWVVLLVLVLTPNESSGSAGFSVATVSPLRYLATQPGVVCHYMKLILWPRHLALDYAWPPALAVEDVIGPAVLVVCLIVIAVRGTWRRSWAGFCLLWFFAVLAPSSSFVPVLDYAFEHRVYLPLAGPAILFAGVFVHVVEVLARRSRSRVLVVSMASVILSAVVLALMHRTIKRNGDYASLIQITRSNAQVRPHNFRARVMVIDVLLEDLGFEAAEQEARQLILDIKRAKSEGGRLYATSASDPDFFLPHATMRVAQALLFMGRHAESIPMFEEALRLDPDLGAGHHDLAVALAAMGRYEDALREVNRSIEIDPDFSASLMLSGLLAVRRGDYREARIVIERSVTLDERSTIGRLELAWLLATAPDPGARDGSRAVELALDVCSRTGEQSPRALDVLAAAYAESARFEMAEATALRALEMVQSGGDDQAPDGAARLSTIVSDAESIAQRRQCYANGLPWRQRGKGYSRGERGAPSLSQEREPVK